tara:strand:- start:164 stop:361 length:198 start_codon:yes stop_codon:yes gene_type:complete
VLLKRERKGAIIIVCVVALILTLAAVYSNYSTKKTLEYKRKKADERLELAKEKDSVRFINKQILE